jgi:hypothetical protein
LPPDLATHAAALQDRLVAELDAVMTTAWAVARNRAERLASEVEAAPALSNGMENCQPACGQRGAKSVTPSKARIPLLTTSWRAATT